MLGGLNLDTRAEALSFALGVALIGLIVWRKSRTKKRGLAVQRMYLRSSLPLFVRNALGLVWVWVLAAALGA